MSKTKKRSGRRFDQSLNQEVLGHKTRIKAGRLIDKKLL